GLVPAGTFIAVSNVPLPLPSSTDTLAEPEFATTKSRIPSPLKSATATETGLVPTGKFSAVLNVPSPLPSSTDTLAESEFARTRSRTLSPLKSPTATETGLMPAPKFTAALNVPSPLPKSTEMLSEKPLATAKSGTPSRSKSATIADVGRNPATKSLRATNDTGSAATRPGNGDTKKRVVRMRSEVDLVLMCRASVKPNLLNSLSVMPCTVKRGLEGKSHQDQCAIALRTRSG